LGGVVALAYVVLKAWRNSYTRRQHLGVDLAALYWHFMDGLWVYLFLLLFVWSN
jgi:cytochrome c oxidase subunit 3